jgi:SET domain-containing protein
MLTVVTYLGISKIEGIGLFAGEFIPKGKIIWTFNPKIDVILSSEDMEQMPDIAKPALLSFSEQREDGTRLLCGDNARFMNHSDQPNCLDEDNFRTTAAWDIKMGEELTCDYKKIHCGSDLFN